MSAISWHHKIKDLPDPTRSFLLSRIIEGAKRSQTHCPNRVAPISLQTLHRLLDWLPSVIPLPYDQLAYTAALLLAYHAALRAGEVVQSGSLAHTIHLKHISFSNQGLTITIPSAKHAPEPSHLRLLASPNERWCPVASLRRYLAARSPIPGPLFISLKGAPITRVKLAAALKSCGIPPAAYNTHSLRVGRATDLALQGASDATIRATGRWKSNAFLKYIRYPIFELP